MLSELFAWMEAGRDEDIYVQLAEARWSRGATGDELFLALRITQEDDQTFGSAELMAHGVRAHVFTETTETSISYVDEPEHVALRQYTDARHELYVNHVPELEITQALGALYMAHRALTAPWIDFERYFNRGMPPEQLLARPCMLARGPAFLITLYREVLDSFSYRTSTLEVGPAKWWTGTNWQDQTAPVSMLTFGYSHVIAERFTVSALTRA